MKPYYYIAIVRDHITGNIIQKSDPHKFGELEAVIQDYADEYDGRIEIIYASPSDLTAMIQ